MITKKITPRSLKVGTIMFATTPKGDTKAFAIIIENDKISKNFKYHVTHYEKGNVIKEQYRECNYKYMLGIIDECHTIIV